MEPEVNQGATKKHPKIDLRKRSRKRCAPERQNGQDPDLDWPSLATIFDQKSQKRHQKRHAKIDVEKVSKNGAKSDQK